MTTTLEYRQEYRRGLSEKVGRGWVHNMVPGHTIDELVGGYGVC